MENKKKKKLTNKFIIKKEVKKKQTNKSIIKKEEFFIFILLYQIIKRIYQ